MGVRLALLACKTDHDSVWLPRRGDETHLEVSGTGGGMTLELVCDEGEEVQTYPLIGGVNPFPTGVFSRYRVTKRVCEPDGREISTTVKICSGD